MGKEKVVLLLSGGMDSYIAAYRLSKEYEVYSLAFDYGQTNLEELRYAKLIADDFNFKHKTKSIRNMFDLDDSPLTSGNNLDFVEGEPTDKFFVPNRNTIFLVYAFNYARKVGAHNIAFSISGEEQSYPDATKDFVSRMEDLLTYANDYYIKILLPIYGEDKTDLYAYADKEGILPSVKFATITCGNTNPGIVEAIHPWGIGCGKCSNCHLRESRYNDYLEWKEHGSK